MEVILTSQALRSDFQEPLFSRQGGFVSALIAVEETSRAWLGGNQVEHPIDEVLRTLNLPIMGLPFPPRDWEILQRWGDGWALRCRGLRAIIDVEVKDDGRWWAHLSVSRKDWPPSHADMATTKSAFFGERYAYAVFPPTDLYVNIHPNCLHLWALIDETDGRVLPEFSAVLNKIGRSI